MEKISLTENKNSIMIWSASIIAALIFSSWHLLPIFFGISFESFFISASSSFFQSIQSWQPLISSVAEGKFSPAAPNASNASGFYFYPYFALWFYGIALALVRDYGVLLLSQVIFPTVCFILIIKIFNRYLSCGWSIAIAFLSTMSFSSLPFRQFLVGLILGDKTTKISTLQPLEILHFPFPSLSLFVFLALYYFSTKQVKLTKKRITGFTLLWALNTQIHLLDAFFGLIFWFTYFPIRFFRQEKLEQLHQLIPCIIPQLFLTVVLILPALLSLTGNVSDLEIVMKNGDGVGLYYYLSYFALPLLGCVLAYFIFRIDVFEILLKFWHIYVLMFAELILISAIRFFDISVGFDIVKNRIPLFFLHFYYYVPVIYFATRPLYHDFKRGIESKKISAIIRSIAIWFFNSFSKFYLPLLVVLLVIFAASSSFEHFNYYKSLKQITAAEIENFKKIDEQLAVAKNSTTAFADPILINLANAKSYKTLWPNRFSNNISQDEIILRVALHGKIFGWKIDEFTRFMLPGKLQQGSGEIINLSENIADSGIGYWLVFHKKNLVEDEKKKYQEKLEKIYNEVNVSELLKNYGVTHIVSVQKPHLKEIKTTEIYAINEIKIFRIYE